MNTIADSYRFWLDIPGVGIVQAYPQNSELKWTWAKKKPYRFYQLTLDTKLIFMDIPASGIYDFTKLYNLERMGMTCERVGITMDRYCECDNTWDVGFYAGYLRLSQADQWNVSGCRVGLPVVVEDASTCFTSKWDKDVNLFDYGTPAQEVSPYLGEIQRQEFFGTDITTIAPPIWQNQATKKAWIRFQIFTTPVFVESPLTGPQASWAVTEQAGWSLNTIPVDPDQWLQVLLHLKTTWTREFVAGAEPDGDGWIAVTGGWARPVPTSNGPAIIDGDPVHWKSLWENEFSPTDWNDLAGVGLHKTYNVTGLDVNGNNVLNNGKRMDHFLSEWFGECGLEVVSNFLNIHPDDTVPAAALPYYEKAAVDAHGLFLFQVTDVARLDETNSATKALFKVKDLIDTLIMGWNLDISIDGNKLRIEHASYFSRIVGLDLTSPALEHWIAERWAYGYNGEKLPKEEGFAWAIQTDGVGGDFDGFPIEYVNACVDNNEEATPLNLRSGKFFTNVTFVTGNEDFYDSKEILIVATQGGVATSRVQPISGDVKFNGAAALGYLLPRYHDYGRPFKVGLINKVETVLYATIRQKKQVPIPMTMSCLDYRDNFRPEDLVKTQLGAGEIETANWSEPDEVLVLILNHK